MLNDDKIRLMNEIALFEKKERKRERPAEVFFRGDYVAKHMLQSFFAWTLSYGLLLGVVIVMEFALDEKIAFLSWMHMDLCYLVIGAAALGIIFTVWPLWRKAFPRAAAAKA